MPLVGANADTLAHRAMLHNSDDYPDPEEFKPERFIGADGKIDPSVRDPRTIAFGFGRRWAYSLFLDTKLRLIDTFDGIEYALAQTSH